MWWAHLGNSFKVSNSLEPSMGRSLLGISGHIGPTVDRRHRALGSRRHAAQNAPSSLSPPTKPRPAAGAAIAVALPARDPVVFVGHALGRVEGRERIRDLDQRPVPEPTEWLTSRLANSYSPPI
jgi:hypothetical protein